jgi:hypothetical protein
LVQQAVNIACARHMSGMLEAQGLAQHSLCLSRHIYITLIKTIKVRTDCHSCTVAAVQRWPQALCSATYLLAGSIEPATSALLHVVGQCVSSL